MTNDLAPFFTTRHAEKIPEKTHQITTEKAERIGEAGIGNPAFVFKGRGRARLLHNYFIYYPKESNRKGKYKEAIPNERPEQI